MSIINLFAQAATFVSPNGEVLATLPSSGSVARIMHTAMPPRGTVVATPDLREIPVTAYAPHERIEGLPEDLAADILVPAAVADAMRALGLRRRGAVYSPMLLIYRDGRPLGTPGLILHEDLAFEARPDHDALERGASYATAVLWRGCLRAEHVILSGTQEAGSYARRLDAEITELIGRASSAEELLGAAQMLSAISRELVELAALASRVAS